MKDDTHCTGKDGGNSYVVGLDAADVKRVVASATQQANEALETWRKSGMTVTVLSTNTQLALQGVMAEAEVLRGDIVPMVLGLAERLNVDLIVLASHGRTGLDALLTGSVAARITGRRIRPLLLVRAENSGDGSS